MRQKQASLDFFLKAGKKENISPLVSDFLTPSLLNFKKRKKSMKKARNLRPLSVILKKEN